MVLPNGLVKEAELLMENTFRTLPSGILGQCLCDEAHGGHRLLLPEALAVLSLAMELCHGTLVQQRLSLSSRNT